MIEWIINNKEWIFSGAGIFILSILITLFSKNKAKNNQSQNIENITSASSTIINQANGNSKIIVNAPKKQKAILNIVDIHEVDEENNESESYIPLIEVKIRNSGEEVAFLKKVTFKTLNHWDIYTDQHPSLKEVSATYDVKISEINNSLSNINISHEIKPQETDRIEFTLSTDYFGDPLGLSIFQLELELFYNEDSSSVKSSQIIMHIPPPIILEGSYFSGYSKNTVSKNKQIAKEILNIDNKNLKITEHIKTALNSWINAPDEE